MPDGLFHDSYGLPLSREQVARIREIIRENLADLEGEAEPLAVRSAIAEERMRTMERQGVPLEDFLKTEAPETSILWLEGDEPTGETVAYLEKLGLVWRFPGRGIRVLCRNDMVAGSARENARQREAG